MHLNRTAVRMTAAMLVFGTLITPASALAGTVKTDNSQLKMRDEASLEGKVVKRLNNGARVEVLEMLDGWKPLCEKYDCSFANLAVAWSAKKSPRMIILGGGRKEQHVRDYLKGGTLALEEQDYKKMNQDIVRILGVQE